MSAAVIVAAARSPIGRAYKGSLAGLRADDLATAMVRAALAQIPELDPAQIDDLVLGCAQPAGEQGYGLGRVVAVQLGLDQVPATTVQRYCASSLQSTRMAAHAINAGEADVMVSAGVEMVSRYGHGKADGMPDTRNRRFERAGQRSAERAAAGVPPWTDPRAAGELPDVYIAMGQTAENVAQYRQVSRQRQDEYAAESQGRAQEARATGFFDLDITPVSCPDGSVVDQDDGPRAGVTAESLATLKTVFRPDGSVTAGNCCGLNDGAAALVVMSSERAESLGLKPMARILSTAVAALSPEIMGLGTVEASRRALKLAGLDISAMDVVEINEAFAAQVLPTIDDLGVDRGRVNPFGGAIALGHPFGQTGARMATTLINGLRWRDGRYGLETMCAAGGQGMAMVIERLA